MLLLPVCRTTGDMPKPGHEESTWSEAAAASSAADYKIVHCTWMEMPYRSARFDAVLVVGANMLSKA